MKILIVRHGEPNYEIDGLTERGKTEAELLADRLCKENIAKLYCSTLGRARLTAEPTLKRLGISAGYCEWLREFSYAEVTLPYLAEPDCAWDLLPSFAEKQNGLYSTTDWLEVEHIKNSSVPEAYRAVCRELDATLARHGYERDGRYYKAIKPNHDTLVFVCHFGLESVLLSHLMNCSPYTLWQHTCAAPTSVTTVYTEEREEGLAHFRVTAFGDTSHLYCAGVEPSSAARFRECFTDGKRH